MSSRLKRIKILTLTPILLFSMYNPNIQAKEKEYETVLEKTNNDAGKIMPTEDYNLTLKVNKQLGTEEYTYYNRYTGEAEKYIMKDGEVIKKIITEETLHPYALLYKEDSRIIFPDIENVYFSYFTLPDTVDYIYQKDTGKYGYDNCAPSSIAMAYNWANSKAKDDGITAQWIRDSYNSDNGDIGKEGYELGYTTRQKEEIYKDLGLDVKLSGYYTDSNMYLQYLSRGEIINLTVNSADLFYNSDRTSRIDKSYSQGGGHSILCTGYLYIIREDIDTGKVTEELYFEIVDPAEGNEDKVRYYRKESIDRMLLKNNCMYIAVKHNGGRNNA